MFLDGIYVIRKYGILSAKYMTCDCSSIKHNNNKNNINNNQTLEDSHIFMYIVQTTASKKWVAWCHGLQLELCWNVVFRSQRKKIF